MISWSIEINQSPSCTHAVLRIFYKFIEEKRNFFNFFCFSNEKFVYTMSFNQKKGQTSRLYPKEKTKKKKLNFEKCKQKINFFFGDFSDQIACTVEKWKPQVLLMHSVQCVCRKNKIFHSIWNFFQKPMDWFSCYGPKCESTQNICDATFSKTPLFSNKFTKHDSFIF